MKTKHLLLATLALPSIFTACSDEEIVSDIKNIDLENRAKIEVSFNASLGEAANESSTRMGLNGLKFFWNDGDMLGAALMEDAVNIVGNTARTNYPFTIASKSEDGTAADFTTNTAVVAGNYIFYHNVAKGEADKKGYDGDLVKTGSINTSLDAVQIAKAGDNSLATAKNLFISPVLNLKEGIKYNASNDMPLKFVPVFGAFQARLTLKSDDSNRKKVQVQKICVETGVSGSNFIVGGDIDASAIATLSGNKGTVTFDGLQTNEQLSKALDDAKNAMDIANIFQTSNKTESNVITCELDEAFGFTTADTQLEVTFLVPAGEYTGDADHAPLVLKVYTTEGVYASNIGKVGVGEKIQIKRSSLTTASRTMNYEINNSDIKKLTTYEVNTLSDWNYYVSYVQNHLGDFADVDNKWKAPVFELKSDLTIASFPNFGIEVTGSKQLTIDAKGAFTLPKDAKIGSELVIAAGTTMNLNGEGFENKTINTITAAITNYGIINIVGAETIWEMKAAVTNDATVEVKTGVIVNGGTIKTGAYALTNNNILTNNGTITVETSGSVVNAATLLNTGTIAFTGNGTNVGGTITLVNKDAEITGDSKLDNTNGTISIVDPSNVKLPTFVVGKEGIITTTVSTIAGYDAAQKISQINNVTLASSLTINATPEKGLTLNDGVTLTLADKADGTAYDNAETTPTIIVNGKAFITAAKALTFNVKTMLINKDGEFTNAKDVTLAMKTASTDATTFQAFNIQGSLLNNGTITLGVDKSTAIVGNDGTNGQPKNTTASLTNSKDATIGEDSKGLDVTNNGTVTYNEQGIVHGSVKNIGGATFHGNVVPVP